MVCNHGSFWMGLGIGSILGAVMCRLSHTAKAKKFECEMYEAIHRLAHKVEVAAAEAEHKAKHLGVAAAETGAHVADKVAEGADKVAGKAKEMWEK